MFTVFAHTLFKNVGIYEVLTHRLLKRKFQKHYNLQGFARWRVPNKQPKAVPKGLKMCFLPDP